MVNSQCRTFVQVALLGLASFAAPFALRAQDAKPVSRLFKQVDRLDLALTADGELTGDSHGTNYLNQAVSLVPSRTVGYKFTLRYIAKPLVGFEVNYGYSRYSENFTLGQSTTYPADKPAVYGVQSDAKEYSAGYVAHTPKSFFGITPFAAVGLGTMRYQPTVGGGYSLPKQYRAAYYYGIGGETYIFADHIGVRAQFRQLYHNAPDFLTNYLTIHQHTFTSEPEFGVFLRF